MSRPPSEPLAITDAAWRVLVGRLRSALVLARRHVQLPPHDPGAYAPPKDPAWLKIIDDALALDSPPDAPEPNVTLRGALRRIRAAVGAVDDTGDESHALDVIMDESDRALADVWDCDCLNCRKALGQAQPSTPRPATEGGLEDELATHVRALLDAAGKVRLAYDGNIAYVVGLADLARCSDQVRARLGAGGGT